MNIEYIPAPPPPPPTAYQPDGADTAIIVGVSIAMAAIVAGSFGPFMTGDGWTTYGMEGPDQFAAGGLIWGLGAGAAAWAGLARRNRGWLIASAVAFAVVAVAANSNVSDVQELATWPEWVDALNVGVGLWAVLAGGLVGCVASIAAAIRNKPTV